MNEKEILQKIKDDAESLTPPASLQPDAIERMLKEQAKESQNTQDQPESPTQATGQSLTGQAAAKPDAATTPVGTAQATDNEKVVALAARKKRYRRIAQFGSVAAVFALAFLVFSRSERLRKSELSGQDNAAQNAGKAVVELTTEDISAENTEDAAVPKADAATVQADAGTMQTDDDMQADTNAAQTDANSAQTDAAQDNSDTVQAGAGSAMDNAKAAPLTEALTYASSYEEVYDTLSEQFGPNGLYRSYDMKTMDAMDTGSVNLMGGMGDIAMESAQSVEMDADGAAVNSPAAPAPVVAEDGASDYSDTNVQEKGVDEADIVKTDGKYLYILRQDGSLAILSADLRDPTLISVTVLGAPAPTSEQTAQDEDFRPADDVTTHELYVGESGQMRPYSDIMIHEMYLDGDTLSVITSCYANTLEAEGDIYYTNYGRETKIYTYDVSDREHPALVGTVAQDGSYEDSRKNGSYIYLFTCYRPTIGETYDESAIVPRINKTQLPADDFYVPKKLHDSSYLVISSMDTKAPDTTIDSKILVSGATDYYVSPENIYIANEHYNGSYSTSTTELVKFHYEDGTITGTAAGVVKGTLNDSFSLNEYNGMLRVVTTYEGDAFSGVREFVGDLLNTYYEDNWIEHNALYVLDEKLQTVGYIGDLAEGETIRSARFFGDTGYFVTFRQTDPLFSVDLSDPANPKILGELKIDGFSSYLHFYGENLLLGIGYEADEETGITSGLKLSMFDISDPTDVQEVSRYTIPGVTWCPAIEDYKAIMVSPEKNLFGFFCDDRYLLFSYDAETGFTRELLYDFFADGFSNAAEYNNLRGLYIGDGFYLAGDAFVITFDMENGFEKAAVLPLDQTAEEIK